MKQTPQRNYPYEYRVTYHREDRRYTKSRTYQMREYAFRFIDKLLAGQDQHGWLTLVKLERRSVGVWEVCPTDGDSP